MQEKRRYLSNSVGYSAPLCLFLMLLSPSAVDSLQVNIPGITPECYSQHGDLNIGLLLRLHMAGTRPELCSDELYKVQRLSYLEAFVYAIRDVNARQDLLPDIILGFLVLDTCATRVAAVTRALYFIPEPENGTGVSYMNTARENCVDGPSDMPIVGIVGPPSSGDALLVGSLLSGFQIPMISPSATSDELSDKTRYEYFLRMVPPDKFQVQAMVDLLLHYNWTYVSLLFSQGEYGLNAADHFEKSSKRHGICIALGKMFMSDLTDEDADQIYADLVQNGKARAVILFLHSSHQRKLFEAAARYHLAGEYQFRFYWIASDYMVGKDYGEELNGAFIMYHSFPSVPAFERYYSELTPDNNAGNPWMRAYWAKIYGCTWNVTGLNENPCEEYTTYTGWKGHVDTYVAAYIDAVYAYAHALDSMVRLSCPSGFEDFANVRDCINRPLLLQLLRNLTFEGTSGRIHFDSSGDAMTKFSIRQFMNSRPVKHQEVGVWYPGEDESLVMQEDLVEWSAFSSTRPDKIPESLCSKPCGENQQIIPTDSSCCWSCGNCRNNEILVSNKTACSACDNLYWPDPVTLTECLPVTPNYLHPEDGTGLFLLLTASLGLVGTITVMIWYYSHTKEKLIKASSRELSAIIFSGMILAYVTVFALLVRPTHAGCAAIRVGWHVSVTLIYSPLLMRTLRIYRIFTGAKKGVKQQKLIGSRSQLAFTAVILVPQILFVTLTCLVAPPVAQLRMPLPQRKLVELFCDFSVGGVMAALSYNLCLLAVCAVLGFLTRRLPDNFSESWYIFVSVSTTLVLWAVTVPALLTALFAHHRYILAGCCLITNASVTLICLFLPKVYAVHFVDEQALNLRADASRVATEPGESQSDAPNKTQETTA